MAFEWNRIHKWEDNIYSQVDEMVQEYVFEYYGVEELTELTEEQIQELEDFRNDPNCISEYSPLQYGFSTLINWWESETWEAEQEGDS